MQLIKDMQFEFTPASITGWCAARGRPRHLVAVEGGTSCSAAKAVQLQPGICYIEASPQNDFPGQ